MTRFPVTLTCAVLALSIGALAQHATSQDAAKASGTTAVQADIEITHGPIVGHVSPRSAMIWARVSVEGEVRASAWPKDGTPEQEVSARAAASSARDRCVIFRFDGLAPGTAYRYTVHAAKPESGVFTTPPSDEIPARVRLAFGSCAKEDSGTANCWTRLETIGPAALVLLGDTPYIDTTKLEVQRKRYQEFAAVPSFVSLVRNRPLYSTWDDHDFGRNDTNGLLEGKAAARQAFVEYHAGATEYGRGGNGVYCSFRRGPVEVFLLDTRWFAGTEDSAHAEGKKTLLGREQWAWLRAGLKASTAPFKLIACGMIWNDAVRPKKTDYWGAYPWERDALFAFIGEEKVSGCVLVGGDIHRSRVVRHDSRAAAGYDLIELITSPLHDSIIEAANVPHPGLIKDMGEINSFMLITADSTRAAPTLQATFMNAAGAQLFEISIPAANLGPEQGPMRAPASDDRK